MGVLKKIGSGLLRFSWGLFKVALAIGVFIVYYLGLVFFAIIGGGD